MGGGGGGEKQAQYVLELFSFGGRLYLSPSSWCNVDKEKR